LAHRGDRPSRHPTAHDHPNALLRLGFFRLFFTFLGLFGENKEIIENLLRKLFIFKEFARVVGHNEIVGLLAIANSVGVMLLILNDTHDLKLDTPTICGFDNQNVSQIDLSLNRDGVIMVMIVVMIVIVVMTMQNGGFFVLGSDDTFS
jgi:hypothetical protein